MANPALRTRIVAAVAAAVDALRLQDVEAVYVRAKGRQGATQTFPCVEVRRADAPDVERPHTLEQDAVGYGVLVLFKFRDQLGPDTLADERADGWFERIAHRLRSEKLPGLPEVWQVTVEPLPVFDPAKAGYQNVQGGLVARCLSVEPRGPLPA